MDCISDFFFSEKPCWLRNVAVVVGVLVLARMALRVAGGLCSGLRAFFLAPLGIGRANLLKYGKWAVVTGASEGIGRGYALELAKRGLNVVLMSRSREKLDKVAKEVEEKYKRETRVIPVDFSSTGLDIYTEIRKQLSDLDVGVLVNNVGMSYPYNDIFGDMNAERFYNMVHLNCQPIVQMSHVLLPDMVKRGGGYIINLSSSASTLPIPQLFVYSATKMFVNYISDGLRKEYGSKGITVQTVIPMFVSTSMTGNMRSSFFIRTAISYTRAAVATIGIQNTTFGCFPHAIQGSIIKHLPTSLVDRYMNKTGDAIRARYLRKQERGRKKE